MTRKEFTKIIGFLSAVIDKPMSEATIEAWYVMLKDLDYPETMMAVKKVLAESQYPTMPAVGQIRKAAAELEGGQAITGAQAWGMLLQAIHKYGFYREREALESLPQDVAKVVDWMGWSELCHGENVDVIRGQFLKMYDNQVNRQKELGLMPQDIRDLLTDVGEKLKIGDRSD